MDASEHLGNQSSSQPEERLVLNSVNSRKSRGGYYTPDRVARFLSQWAIVDSDSQVLEPSAGDGQFLEAALTYLSESGHITAVELDSTEARKAEMRGGGQSLVFVGDFFDWFSRYQPIERFDAVVGNPPFIRYQNFKDKHRKLAFELMTQDGLRTSKLMNAWLPFVVGATKALRTGGRLAFVLPAELLQVKYATQLRQYLIHQYSQLTIITFRHLLFSTIQEETILLLGVKGNSTRAAISFLELDGIEDLQTVNLHTNKKSHNTFDYFDEKWTQFYLTPYEMDLIRQLNTNDAFCTLGDLAEVNVGIVTGRNEFFVLTRREAALRQLLPWCIPMVGRSQQIPGLSIAKSEWESLVHKESKCFLLQLGNKDREQLSEPALTYVRQGEQAGFHEGYKCRIRQPRWWNVPSVWSPDAFLLRQIHEGLRIVHNPDEITCTDTIHRVKLKEDVDGAWLAAASVNSLTYAFAELRGRSYGGGVLELEPTEAESMLFPKPSHAIDLERVDRLSRDSDISAVLDVVDKQVLCDSGLDKHDVKTLRGIWRKLSERRIRRKRR